MLRDDGTIDQDFFKPKQVRGGRGEERGEEGEEEEKKNKKKKGGILKNFFRPLLDLLNSPRSTPLLLLLFPNPPPPNPTNTQVIIVEDKKWGPAERDALYKGLETFGVGGWRSIVDTLLPRWEETALRVKAGRLMGTQSLARYVGWKGNREAVDAEFAKNKELGEATGCWKGGVLVEDDAGSVAAELTRRAAAAAVAAAAGAGK